MFDPQSKVGEVLDSGRLRIVDVIGSGSFAVVYLVENVRDPSTRYAVKCLFKHGLTPAQLHIQRMEASLLQALGRHPNLVQLHKVLETDDCLFLVMEYCPNDLFEVITTQHLSEDTIRSVFTQILSVVAHCHRKGVFHRDLKPENILVVNGRTPNEISVKLTDFGLATTELLSTDFGCGSIRYMAPECLRQDEHPATSQDSSRDTHEGSSFLLSRAAAEPSSSSVNPYQPAKNDIWSLGIILVNLVSTKNPWRTPNASDVNYAAFISSDPSGSGPRLFQSQFAFTADAERILLQRMLNVDPNARATPEELLRLLKSVPRLRDTMEFARLTMGTPDPSMSPQSVRGSGATSFRSRSASGVESRTTCRNGPRLAIPLAPSMSGARSWNSLMSEMDFDAVPVFTEDANSRPDTPLSPRMRRHPPQLVQQHHQRTSGSSNKRLSRSAMEFAWAKHHTTPEEPSADPTDPADPTLFNSHGESHMLLLHDEFAEPHADHMVEFPALPDDDEEEQNTFGDSDAEEDVDFGTDVVAQRIRASAMSIRGIARSGRHEVTPANSPRPVDVSPFAGGATPTARTVRSALVSGFQAQNSFSRHPIVAITAASSEAPTPNVGRPHMSSPSHSSSSSTTSIGASAVFDEFSAAAGRSPVPAKPIAIRTTGAPTHNNNTFNDEPTRPTRLAHQPFAASKLHIESHQSPAQRAAGSTLVVPDAAAAKGSTYSSSSSSASSFSSFSTSSVSSEGSLLSPIVDPFGTTPTSSTTHRVVRERESPSRKVETAAKPYKQQPIPEPHPKPQPRPYRAPQTTIALRGNRFPQTPRRHYRNSSCGSNNSGTPRFATNIYKPPHVDHHHRSVAAFASPSVRKLHPDLQLQKPVQKYVPPPLRNRPAPPPAPAPVSFLAPPAGPYGPQSMARSPNAFNRRHTRQVVAGPHHYQQQRSLNYNQQGYRQGEHLWQRPQEHHHQQHGYPGAYFARENAMAHVATGMLGRLYV